ncbi:MAG: serine/threonine protein kinase [Curvibacter sp.]|nr:MAG: serine/threonine protein kinase [Curvibacter sp.]
MSSPALPEHAAQGPSHADALPVGTRLAEFDIEGLLGVGGFGLVYKAFDRSLQRPVAIKEYLPGALVGRGQGLSVALRSPHEAPAFQRGLQGFLNEARMLASFDHPSLVKVFRFWETHGTAYMAMPLYQGMTLQQARSQMRGPPPEAWLRKVIGGLLGALQCLHDHQTLHRDVSPDNIFLQDIGPPVLLDLGAARRALAGTGHQHTAILKVHYAPIEQYADSEDMQPGPWSDLYSLAAVVYDCLCGQAPTPATFRIIKDRMQPFHEVARVLTTEFGLRYSQPFLDGLSQALEIRPELRPASTRALADCMQLSMDDQNLSRFDWRDELGDLWLPAAQAQGVMARTEPDAVTQPWPQRPVDADVADVPANPQQGLRGPAPTIDLSLEPAPPVPARQASTGPGRLIWGAVAVLLLMSTLGAWLGWRSHEPAPVVAVVPAVPSAPTQPPPEEEILPSASGASMVAVPKASVGTPPTARASSPPPVSVPHPSASHPTPGAALPPPLAGARLRRQEPVPKSTDAASGAVPDVRAADTAVDKNHQSGASLCADVGILLRTLCMHRECAKPRNAETQACVDYRRGMQERARRPDNL